MHGGEEYCEKRWSGVKVMMSDGSEWSRKTFMLWWNLNRPKERETEPYFKLVKEVYKLNTKVSVYKSLQQLCIHS